MRIIQAPKTQLSQFFVNRFIKTKPVITQDLRQWHSVRTFFQCAAMCLSTLALYSPADAETTAVNFDAMLAATHEQTLENGLKIIVREDHRSPIVACQIWYRVGASDEPNHLTGISHVLEHMMFKGTDALKPGEFSTWVSELGGNENAFTARDETVYYQTWGKQNMPLSLALEADRMQHLLLLPEEFSKELDVVKEERRLRTEDNPNAKLYERFLRTVYSSSPYGQPVIGWMHDLDKLTHKDIQQWYQTWYRPNNATLIVVGDVNSEAVFTEAQKAFGHIPAGALPKRNRPREIEPLGEKRLTVKVPAQLPSLLMGYVVPSLTTAENPNDAHALYMLSNILDGGDSARLSRHLVRGQEMAAEASAGYSPISRGDTLFLFSATPNSNPTKPISIAELESAIKAEIKALQENPPTEEEVDRVRTQLISSLTYDQDSISGQAHGIGQLESAGMHWHDFPKLIEALSTITPEAIQTAAQKYLISDHLTVGILDPQPLDSQLSKHRSSTGILNSRHLSP